MFSWFRRHRRDRFDPAWQGWLERGVWQYRCLAIEQRERVHVVVAHLVARKHWTGGSGFRLHDKMRVTVSGVAALMTLGLDKPFFFPRLKSFILYPAAYRERETNPGVGILGGHDPITGMGPRLGEAWQRGPVLLSWRTVERQARVRGRGRNLVLHEMAHHIDGYDGDMDGAPYFDASADRRRWHAVAEEEYHRLVGQARRREVTLLDHYGATNRAEFLAVATECFFERPHAMKARHAELYGLLAAYYQQDPTDWIPPAARLEEPASPSPRKERRPTGGRRASQANLAGLGLRGVDELFSRGVLMLNHEEYEQAARLFTEVLHRTPDDAEAHQHRAEARFCLRDFHGVIRDTDAALEADPQDLPSLLLQASASLELGDDATAEKLLERIRREDRENPAAWVLEGRLAARAGAYRKAVQAFRRALSYDALDADAHLWLAECLDRTNDPGRAENHRNRAVQLDPSLAGARLPL